MRSEAGKRTLFHHTPHAHIPSNVNALHQAEQSTGTFNQKLAVTLTKVVGTMACAYVFALLAIFGIPALQSVLGPYVAEYVQWLSQTFIQLTMLSILMVGQSIMSRHQELQAEEAFNTTVKSFHDVEQIMAHLDVQDQKIMEILAILEKAMGRA